ncbi:acetyl/propionyl/methylcrotonyl-CoA carboxylase subunit alpha [Aliiglaciecola sp. LCG003]|uniref:acetyl/propionyl/methylcrotonyl-CoA carboxylase subunit alpha n=1 Tax=Aliiglaciecola sp. LCG003 TaxID=3053655 RepID=UPI0025740C35|nr:acetyl/propionyl/methylcrotonyl-CoA carboxylase subunit alpha [Aliiglaciecola sp. LCG003]WJG11307.1 acetyl/propionyl/methylcrotonyl-CoA carboxylase subunit alpha [Aliiglaciecola sp. LCG003]
MMKTLNKILIANRGEIAVRVIQTARRLGYRTVAIYSDADSQARHVLEADQAVCVGPATAAESYLVIENIIAAALKTGADGIHPGYGFLSENASFARACENAGITFIGPDAEAIELMGSKRLSKVAMIAAGVPCIDGYQSEDQSDQVLIEKAQQIGFPLMVKASAGGGGRGMRLVNRQSELADQIKTARSEAKNAFGSGELILERAVIEPRHIEIQVFADTFGNTVYLGERDCSIQRRHQKVVEEAPSPFVDDALRERMGQAAVEAAKACNYIGAGTVEFLVDKDKNFYFLEMNTRLQVEHPVTELVTGQDLVAWQLMVATGEPLPLTQEQIVISGHAIEVRLYAEDPRNGFMPQTGEVLCWQTPEQREGIRIDYGINCGDVISAHYDPMLAKIIAYGDSRSTAVRRLASATQDTQLLGVNSNKHFLEKVLKHPAFLAAQATTAFIEQHFTDDDSICGDTPDASTLARAAIIYYQHELAKVHNWDSAAGQAYTFKLDFNGQVYAVRLVKHANDYLVSTAKGESQLELVAYHDCQCVVVEDGIRETFYYVLQQDVLYLDDGTGHYKFDNVTHKPAVANDTAGSGEVKAPMDGVIVNLLVQENDKVEAGQILVVMEAMKMEHQMKATIKGRVDFVGVAVGQQVKSKQLLVAVSAEQAKNSNE